MFNMYSFETLIKLVNMVDDDRKDKVSKFFHDQKGLLEITPSSGKGHSNYPGGLLDHTVLVTNIAIKLYKASVYEDLVHYPGKDFVYNLPSKESVILCALLHDIGKLGTPSGSYYEEQNDDWRRSKLNELYTIRKDRVDLPHELCAIQWLNAYHIELKDDELQALIYHAGRYNKASEYIRVETPLMLLVHMADNIAVKFYNI